MTNRHSSDISKSSSLSGKAKKVSPVHEYGQGLVGSRIRVWWPFDRKFYDGVVESFSSSRRKHRVVYDDGDVESLDMKKEYWQLIEEEEDTVAEEISVEEAVAEESSDGTPEPVDTGKTKRKLAGKGMVAIQKKKHKTGSSTNSKLGNVGGKIVAAASRMSVRFPRKANSQAKAVSARKNTAASNNPVDEDTSADDSEPLANFVNKLKATKEKERGEKSSRNGVEEGSSGSEAGEEDSEEESGEDSSDNESGESSSKNKGEEGSEGEEEAGESSGNESD